MHISVSPTFVDKTGKSFTELPHSQHSSAFHPFYIIIINLMLTLRASRVFACFSSRLLASSLRFFKSVSGTKTSLTDGTVVLATFADISTTCYVDDEGSEKESLALRRCIKKACFRCVEYAEHSCLAAARALDYKPKQQLPRVASVNFDFWLNAFALCRLQ